ncbi:MAG: RimK family alpha-L-glutamate ligase, partial [Nanoarchaeota archaeon]|nr:RimK family alpha-L-glutamate ligase [Nanoarchaeota archaeon]MBU1704605.1 RimK family alpha-L-glutamate ligase [Nanoarchaeota archaeon]
IGHDKLLTHLVLNESKIPMPTTYLASSPESAKSILEKVNYPIIMKLPSGTGGKGVMFAESFAAASSILDTLNTLRQPFIIQEYVETGGVDIRVIVVGDKIAAAMKRKAVVGEKRSNIHAGGMGESIILDNHTKKIAIDTAKAMQTDVIAVDILESAKGPVVIEANLSPGLQGITAATGIDVADKIARFLYEQSSAQTETGKSVETSKILEELGIKTEVAQQIITNLDFRANRILLPKIVTDVTKFNEKDELILKIEKGKLVVEKSNIG